MIKCLSVTLYISDTLGMVPMWGEATESVIEEYQKRLKLSTTEMELLFGAYREDNHNGRFESVTYL